MRDPVKQSVSTRVTGVQHIQAGLFLLVEGATHPCTVVGNLCAFSARNCLDASFEDETSPLVKPNEKAAAGPRKSSGGADEAGRSSCILSLSSSVAGSCERE